MSLQDGHQTRASFRKPSPPAATSSNTQYQNQSDRLNFNGVERLSCSSGMLVRVVYRDCQQQVLGVGCGGGGGGGPGPGVPSPTSPGSLSHLSGTRYPLENVVTGTIK